MSAPRRALRLALAIGVLICGPAISQSGAQQGLRFSTDPDAPLEVNAASMRWNQADGVSDLTGATDSAADAQVSIRQGPMQWRADTMRLRMGPEGLAQSLSAQGRVTLVDDSGQTARAGQADFDLEKDIMMLRGDVVVERRTDAGQAQKLSGATLSINMVTGQARLRGGKTRARIELAP